MPSTVQYGGSWTTASDVIEIHIRHVLNSPKYLRVTISNPDHTHTSTYSEYDEIRVLEADTNLNIFRGKIEKISTPWDQTYGQVLILEARDNLQELAKRAIDSDYSGTQRSAVIKSMIDDHVYSASNIDTTNATKFTSSGTNTLTGDIEYSGSDKSVLRAIQELAVEDPWTTGEGFAFDFYIDSDLDFNYFQRGTIPSGGASANGLTIEFGASGEDAQTRLMMPNFDFSFEGKELYTLAKIRYVDDNNAAQSESFFLMNIGSIVGTFNTNDIITGSTSGLSANVRYVGSTFLVVSDWTSTGIFTIGETITGSNSSATATISSIPRQSIGQDVEIVFKNYEKKNLTDAVAKAAEYLFHTGSQIIRGNVEFYRYPYYDAGGGDVAVLTGDLVRITNSNASIDQDMVITALEYTEGPGRLNSKIDVVGKTRGVSFRPSHFDGIYRATEEGNNSNIGAIGGLPTSAKVVALDFNLIASGHNTVTFTGGTATYSDGTTQTITSTGSPKTISGRTYCYIIYGSSTLQFSTSFSDTIGGNKSLVAIMEDVTDDTGANCRIVDLSGSGEITPTGFIANEISAISANLGTIVAGNIVLPGQASDFGGTIAGLDPTVLDSDFYGLVMSGSGIIGYNNGNRIIRMNAQASGSGDEGEFQAITQDHLGNDRVITRMNASGISIIGNNLGTTPTSSEAGFRMRSSGDAADMIIIWSNDANPYFTTSTNSIRMSDIAPEGSTGNVGLLSKSWETMFSTQLTLTENTGASPNYVRLAVPSSFATNYEIELPGSAPTTGDALYVTGTSGTNPVLATTEWSASSLMVYDGWAAAGDIAEHSPVHVSGTGTIAESTATQEHQVIGVALEAISNGTTGKVALVGPKVVCVSDGAIGLNHYVGASSTSGRVTSLGTDPYNTEASTDTTTEVLDSAHTHGMASHVHQENDASPGDTGAANPNTTASGTGTVIDVVDDAHVHPIKPIMGIAVSSTVGAGSDVDVILFR